MNRTEPSITRRALTAFSALVLLAGCATNSAPAERERPLGADLPDPQYALTVSVTPGDTLEGVEARYGGRARVWEPGVFAVIGVDSDIEGAEANSNAFLSGGERAQMNGTSKLWAGGTSKLWAGGTSKLWAGGTSKLWAGGEYAWMPENTSLWQQVRLEEGHAVASNLGHGVKVAVIDTGVDLKHPALGEALAPEDEWWDFYGGDALPQEEGTFGEGGYGHGTNVAGIIRQVAPRATILPIRVLGPDGGGNLTDVASAIHWAQKRGAQVINLSLGSDEEVKAIEKVIDAVAKKGVFVVASTGNTGDTAVTYPARSAVSAPSAPLRLSVTSVNGGDLKSDFATYGGAVELAAPGENVYSPAPEERMAAWSGTSMAAPMASGALALALGETLAAPKATLAEALKKQSFDLYVNGSNGAYRGQIGQGRLDLELFLKNVVRQEETGGADDGGGESGGSDSGGSGGDGSGGSGGSGGDGSGGSDSGGSGSGGSGGVTGESCQGGVTRLTLRYKGSDDEDVRVVQKDGGKVLFEKELDPGDTFSFKGAKSDGTMGKEIELYEEDDKRATLRTDCKEPIGPGLKKGMFEVLSGESLGGPLPPMSGR